MLARILSDERGAKAVEYGLLAALLTLAATIALLTI